MKGSAIKDNNRLERDHDRILTTYRNSLHPFNRSDAKIVDTLLVMDIEVD